MASSSGCPLIARLARPARPRSRARCHRVAVDRLANAVGVREPFVGVEATGGDLGDPDVEVFAEDRGHAVARAVGVLHDVERTAFGECPHGFGGVWEERRLAEQPLVPLRASANSRTRRPAKRWSSGIARAYRRARSAAPLAERKRSASMPAPHGACRRSGRPRQRQGTRFLVRRVRPRWIGPARGCRRRMRSRGSGQSVNARLE